MTAIRVLGRCGAEQKPESKSAPETKDLIRGATKRVEIQNVRTVTTVRTPIFHDIFFQFEFVYISKINYSWRHPFLMSESSF